MRKKLDKIVKTTLLCCTFIASISMSTNAHNGSKEDANGGHKDILNISKLGNYHYHHGYEAHSHDGGICPKLVEEGKKDGLEHGREHGYSGLQEIEYSYEDKSAELKVYETSYIPEYEKSYNQAFREATKELKLVAENGYKMGLKGDAKTTNDYSHILLKEAYENSYEIGYEEYKKVEAKKYEEDGRKHGYEGISRIQFENQIEEFILAYNNGYDDGVNKRKEEIIKEGKDAAIYNKPKNESYKDEELEWYEEGFKAGNVLLQEIEKKAKEQVDKEAGNEVPAEYKVYEDIYNKYYKDKLNTKEKELEAIASQENRKLIIQTTMICIVAISIIVPIGFLIKNKSKKINNQEEYDDMVA